MAGYIGSKAVNLSTTGADINGDANIDGTLTSDGLTVDADNNNAPQVIFENSHSVTTDAAISTYDDAAGVGITLGSNYYLNSAGSEARFNTSEESAGILVDRTGVITLKTDNSGSAVAKDRLNIAGNGDISFYEDTGTTPKFFWDASKDALEINGSSDARDHSLVVSGDDTGGITSDLQRWKTGLDGGKNLDLTYDVNDNNFDFDAGDRNVTFTTSGNVGIGTSSPGETLDVSGNIRALGANSRVMFGPDGFEAGIKYATDATLQIASRTGESIAFTNGHDGTERMRIDGSGNLLVGTTSFDSSVNGFGMSSTGGPLYTTATSQRVAILNRRSSDGEILNFRKDNTTVGSIGTKDGDVAIGTGTCGIRFNDGANAVIPFNITTNSQSDNTLDLGFSTLRWDDIYATNGTIQTSDRNEKQDIAELSDAEQRVAVACKGLLRKFRWRDAVEAKGDDARTHFGIIAQDLQAAFAAEGLDAGDYAMFISSTWTDEETGEERTRMGVRYSELLAFIIGAL